MPDPNDQRTLLRHAEQLQLGLAAIDTAAAAIAAGLRQNTLDADGVGHLLHLALRPLMLDADILVHALARR